MNNYVDFDNNVERIFNKDNDNLNERFKETDKFKECFNDTYFKLIHLIDISNNEYIACTYGLILHLNEQKHKLSDKDLKELRVQHEVLLQDMNKHFKDKYDSIINKSLDCLKNTIKKEIDNI